jgi:Zn-finger nucleic acid-binding protein
MNCPHCNVTLLMTDKHGVEIDYCPKCRGIWLDRGELEKIIERSEIGIESNAYQGNDRHYDKHDSGHHSGKKKSLLRELFD